MYKVKIITFLTSLVFLGLLFTGSINALSRPTGEIAKARASLQQRLQQRQGRGDTFAAETEKGSSRVFDTVYKRASECKKDDFFLCSSLEDQALSGLGFCISNEVVALSTKMSLDALNLSSPANQGQEKPKIIKIGYPLGTIGDAVSVLQEIVKNRGNVETGTVDKAIVDKSIKPEILNSFNRLSNVTKILGELDCKVNIQRDFLPKLKDIMERSDQDIVNNATFHQLPNGYQNVLLSDSIKTLLQEGIVKRGLLTNTFRSRLPMVISSDGERIVALTSEGGVELFVFDSNQKDYDLTKFPLSGGACSCVTISPDGNTIVAVNPSGIKVINTNDVIGAKNFQAELIRLPNNTIKFLMLNYDGSVLVYWDQQDNIVIRNLKTGSDTKVPKKEVVGFDIISKVLINSSGNKVAVLHDDFLEICSIGTEVVTTAIPGSFKDVVISSDGSRAILLDKNGKIALLDITDGGIKGNYLIGHKKNVSSAAFSPNGRYIATVGDDGFCLWEAKNGSKIYGPSGDATLLGGFSYVPFDDEKSYQISDDFIVWKDKNVKKGEDATKIYQRSDKVTTLGVFSNVAFSHDGRQLLLYSSYAPDDLYINPNERLVCYDIKKILTSGKGPISPEFTAGVSAEVKEISGLSFSDDDRRVIFSGNPIVVKMLLTDEQIEILEKIEKCTIEQKRLIYQLAFAFQFGKSKPLKEGSAEFAIFKTLPNDIQKALIDWVGYKVEPVISSFEGLYGRRARVISEIQERY